MDNTLMPPVQPIQPARPLTPGQDGQIMQPNQDNQAVQPGQNNQPMQYKTAPNGIPMVQQVQAPVVQKKDIAGLVKTIVIIILSMTVVTFIGLFIWKADEANHLQDDVQAEIEVAVASAKDEQTEKMEAEFLEREKNPYKTFTGPSDYGQLTFQYPKTWSVYIANDASNGGNFESYFNPGEVNVVSDTTIDALRVIIRNEAFDVVAEEYRREMERKDAQLSFESIIVNGASANRYTGKIPKTELQGIIVIFKIRDKTAVMRTDSMLFQEDFNRVIESVTFNE